MKIAIGADHAGFALKSHIINFLHSHEYEVIDCGTNTADIPVDYPNYAAIVGKKVALKECPFGILICGTGIGMCIAANKVHGIRAASVSDVNTTLLSRAHNNANILCLGGRTMQVSKAIDLVQIWLTTQFDGGRHERRVEEISKIDSANNFSA